MDRWIGRVALVTGASTGIGADIAKALAINGMKVVGVSIDYEKIQEASKELSGAKGSLIAMKCDMTKDQEIYDLFKKIKDTLGGVDLCINSAGFNHNSGLLDGTTDQWRSLMNINVIAVCLCTKLTIASLKERSVDDGQIINMCSLSGHIVYPMKHLHFYSATKYAVRALTEGFRQELRAAKSHIRIAEISPGMVRTKFLATRLSDNDEAEKYYQNTETLSTEDISALLLHIISAPRHVEINEVIIRPTEFQG